MRSLDYSEHYHVCLNTIFVIGNLGNCVVHVYAISIWPSLETEPKAKWKLTLKGANQAYSASKGKEKS